MKRGPDRSSASSRPAGVRRNGSPWHGNGSPEPAGRVAPIRVLHAYNQHRTPGGSEHAAAATIEGSRRHGLDVEVFTRSSQDLPQNLFGRLQAGVSAVYARDSVKRFSALLDSFAPDVVHIHEVFPLVSPWILPACTRRGVPVVMTCVDYRLTCPIVTHLYGGQVCTRCTEGREYWAVLRNCRENMLESLTVGFYNMMVRRLRLFRDHVTHFIAPSDFTRQWLIEHAAIDPARISTNCPIVAVPPAPADPAQGGYIAYAGRLTPEKGLATLFEAARVSGLPFQVARNQHSPVSVEVPSNVQVVVTRGRAELDEFYRGARMLVVPSIWFETFGLVGAEAMSHGIPVVASRMGALACLADDGVEGLLFEPGDGRDLADKVKRLWDDPDLCRRLGRAARQKVVSSWTAECHFQRLLAIYDKVIARRPARNDVQLQESTP